ncbi:MAG: Hsp20/alpha crystallin family protein [bacterium]
MMMAKKEGKDVPMVTEESFFLEDNTFTTDWLESVPDKTVEGELAVDVYETARDMVVKAPIAGLGEEEDIDITLTEEMVIVKGERREEREVDHNNYHIQECYWGTFSRTVNLPAKGLPEEAVASFNKGILTIRIPKAEVNKLRKLKVNAKTL